MAWYNGPMATETEVVFAELLDELGTLHQRLRDQLSGPDDVLSLLEAHKWILSILQVAADVNVWADTARPRFVDIVGPYKKWGGDNADAFYCYVPIDPSRTYRVRALCGDSVYLSLTVYGGPDDGRYSERIVGGFNSRQLPPGPDGSITMVLSPEDPGDGTPWIRLAPDAVAAITRDYLEDPVGGQRARWEISADDPPEAFRQDDTDLARRLRAAAHLGARAGDDGSPRHGGAQHREHALPGSDNDIRMGRWRCRLRHGCLCAGGRRGDGDPGPFTALRVLEHVPVESVSPYLQLRLRARSRSTERKSDTRMTVPGSSS